MNETFAELGYNAGDTVRCVDDRNRVDDGGCLIYVTGYEYLLRHTTVEPRTNCGHNGYSASWELVSRAASTDADDGYLIWSDMTPEAQGALLLAEHNGEIIQFFCLDEWILDSDPNWWHASKYRVKPADPVVVTHEIFGSNEIFWGYLTNEDDTHKMTYNTIDGVIDCASVRMVEIKK